MAIALRSCCDCTAIMLRLHGVYTATTCDLWAFVPRSKRFHYVFTVFLPRSKRFHYVFTAFLPRSKQFHYVFTAFFLRSKRSPCMFKALSPNDDKNEQQTLKKKITAFVSWCQRSKRLCKC